MTMPDDMTRPDRWVAPWSPEQVAALNAAQADDRFHGYTCPGDHTCSGRTRKLLATPEGWVCDCGGYDQGWAHAVPLAGPGGADVPAPGGANDGG